MSKIKIKNFGPIKEGYRENDGWIEIKKITVFIGNQGSGKSTVSKWISTMTWIEKAMIKDVKNSQLIIQTFKTGSIVVIPLFARLKDALTLIKNEKKIVLSSKANYFLKEIAKISNINKRVSFHTARHTFANLCAENGISREICQQWLGHSDSKTTDIYYKFKSKEFKRAADFFNEI